VRPKMINFSQYEAIIEDDLENEEAAVPTWI